MADRESWKTSIFWRTKAEIISDLEAITKHPHESARSYILKHDLEKLWQDKERIRRLLPAATKDTVVGLVQKELIKILSILVLIAAISQPSDILKKLLRDDHTPRYKDDQIPLELDKIAEFLDPPHDSLFYQTQYIFCPVIIDCSETQPVRYEQNRRLPWDTQEDLGLGAFGQVDLIKIAPRCFREAEGADYPEGHLVACKKFHVRRKSSDELKNLQILKESLTKQDRIMQHLATLRHGDDFYILFPYAEHRDLSLFLHAGRSAADKEEYNFQEEFPGLDLESADPTEVFKLLLRQCWALANAIKWLHSGIAIESSTANEVYCAHMDLKPENILIRHDRNSKVGKWMISDFGISMTPEQEQKKANFLTVGDVYVHLTDSSRLTGSSRPGRVEGSYQAPEATSKKGFEVGRGGDIWSFGCIFTEVLAWAIGRDVAVINFASLRSQTGGNDCFFHAERLSLGPNSASFRVKDSVKQWLDQKIEDTAQQNTVVPCWARAIKAIMIVDPNQRPDASKLEAIVKHVKDHSENPRNHIDDDCPLPRNPRLLGLPSFPPASIESSSSSSVESTYPPPLLPTPPTPPPSIVSSPLSQLLTTFPTSPLSLFPPEPTRDPFSAPVKHSKHSRLMRGRVNAVAVSQAEQKGKTLAAYLSEEKLLVFELDVMTRDCKPMQDPVSLRPREGKLENTGVAINGSHIAIWGYSPPKNTKLVFLRTLTDAQLHLSDPVHDKDLLSVAVSTKGVFALIHEHEIILRQASASPIKLTLPQGIAQTFTHATFNKDGKLLFAWAYGSRLESVYAWRLNPVDPSGKPHFARHYRKREGNHKTSIIPYNSENKCIVVTPEDGEWTAVSLDENQSVASAHALNSQPLKKLVSGYIFQDQSFIGLWSNTLHSNKIVRYQIVDSTSGLQLSNRESLSKVSESYSSSSVVRVFRPDPNDGATVVICDESDKIEFVKFSLSLET